MADSIYTLLIVESPVLAERIQKLSPSSVYVISTDGFCWNPVYDSKKNRLKAIADPEKIELRKEIKEQAQWANNIVVAADSDPSGDFITWSLAKFLNMSGIKRGKIQHLSKKGILNMLSDVSELNSDSLEARLKNRFLIRQLWADSLVTAGFQAAGIIAALGATESYHHFFDENNNLYRSTAPLKSSPDEWISVQLSKNKKQHKILKPLSTFDIISKTVELGIEDSFREAQSLLQKLFQTTLPFSEESLISYPRSSANAFYSETWENFRKQYMHIGSQTDLKPRFLQEVADPETPHESIYPLSLQLTPDYAAGELPRKITSLYKLIYDHTIQSIKIPEPLQVSWINELNPDIFFYPLNNYQNDPKSLRPVLTAQEFGAILNKLGVIRPSKFGEFMDQALHKKWITLQKGSVRPDKLIMKKLHHADSYKSKLKNLSEIADYPSLNPETVRDIISS